jgi:hypothetical protein
MLTPSTISCLSIPWGEPARLAWLDLIGRDAFDAWRSARAPLRLLPEI